MNQAATCKYFLKGTCRFGDRCRFNHPQQSNVFNQGGGAFGGGQQFGQSQYNSYNQQVQFHRGKIDESLAVIEDAVKKDMVEWDKGRIWPLSCYGPINGKANLPGFEDLSYEELRLATLQNNNQPPAEIQSRIAVWNTNREKYQRPSVENRAILEAVSMGKPLPAQLQQQQQFSSFGGQQASSPQNNIFGGGAVTSSPFTSGTQFGGAAKPFGTGATSAISSSPFGGNFSNQGIGSATMEQSMGSGAAAGGGGVTGLSSFSFNQAMSQTQPGFNQGFPGSNPLQTPPQQQQQPFTSTPFPFQANLNQSPQQQPILPNPNVPSGIFGQSQSSFPSPISNSPFGSGGQQQSQFQAMPVNPLNTGGGGDSIADDPTFYTKESDLTPAEIQAFEANSFDLETLPLKAPPKRLCC